MKKDKKEKLVLRKTERSAVYFKFLNYALLFFVIYFDSTTSWDAPEYFYIVLIGVIFGVEAKPVIDKYTKHE